MKKLTTYYFLLLVCFNVFLSLCLSSLTGEYGVIGEAGEPSLPVLLEWAFQRPLWPRIGVAVCTLGAVSSLLGKPSDTVLKNLLMVVLIAELWGMFLSAVAFI